MYPKQKSYIPRFALLINCLDSYYNESVDVFKVSKDSILKAEKLSNYFISNAKKVKFESNEVKEIKNITKKGETNLEKIEAIYKSDSGFNRTKVAEMLGVTRNHVQRIIKQLEEKQ
jgi:DNA-directed RNA polymerase specialized sigma subunit